MKKKIIIAVAVIVILAAGGTFYLNHKVSSAVKDGKIIKGVSCEGISIGGMTRSEMGRSVESITVSFIQRSKSVILSSI